jgi:hypothetical protein
MFADVTVKDLVKDHRVKFQFYRAGELWYSVVDTNFLFPVPISDVGDATFLSEDKAILFMRYIRPYLEKLQSEENRTAAPQPLL